jgi:hypothetical protein
MSVMGAYASGHIAGVLVDSGTADDPLGSD